VGVWEPTFVTCGGLFFKLYPSILKGHNFFNFIQFLMIFYTLDMSIKGGSRFF